MHRALHALDETHNATSVALRRKNGAGQMRLKSHMTMSHQTQGGFKVGQPGSLRFLLFNSLKFL
jgi:hypothetical protein